MNDLVTPGDGVKEAKRDGFAQLVPKCTCSLAQVFRGDVDKPRVWKHK